MAALAVAACFLASLVLGRISIAVGPRLGWVDVPDDHLKPHQGRPVPLGGFGLLIGLQIGLGIAGLVDWGLVAGTSFMWLIGLADDRIGIAPGWRLGAAAVAGALMAILHDPSPDVPAVLAAMALVVLVVNAINLLDGLDALAGSVGAVCALSLALLAGLRGYDQALVGVLLAAGLIGFLAWNLPPARLFLGDNGAYVLGVALAWLVFATSPDSTAGLVATAAIGVPLLDLGATILRRSLTRTPMFAGDREHIYDRLHASGMGVLEVAVLYCGIQVLWAASVIAVSELLGDTVAVLYALGLGSVLIGFSVRRFTRHDEATG